MKEARSNAGPAPAPKGEEEFPIPRLGRRGKTIRNLLLTLVFAAFIWGQYGYPLPAAELEFRRLERTYLAEPSRIVFVSAKGMDGEFQAADGTWLILSRPLVVGLARDRAAVGYSLRGGHPFDTLEYYPLEEGVSPVPIGAMGLWWIPSPGETAVDAPVLFLRVPEEAASGELEMEVRYRGGDYHREGALFDLGDGVWLAGVDTPEGSYSSDWYQGGSYILRLYREDGTLLLEQEGTVPRAL